ncbi:transmembrane protein, putative [Rhizoctonia solani AG-3 Rhs1AP]|uniref:Transmembrane protein, putative n=1 Tax=Rhizoctonia solani AG-3 Rhs1AP TaxID=1086054 RepID=X8IU15_9AGAM|nr:transmembrane protein, putative [Rhizoctonia solani AG-3 Rhs1AP]
MQFNSAFSRLVAFALFMLSFSMLTCAAPAPAPVALAVAGTSEPGNMLVARGDVSDQCHQALVDLDVKINLDIDLLNKCYDTKGCDCKPIVAQIVADIQVCIDIIAKLTGTIDRQAQPSNLDIDPQPILQKIATACGKWVVKLDLSVYLSIFASIDAILVALVNVCVKLSVSLLLQVKLALVLNLQLLLTAKLTALIKILGL